MAVKEEVDSVLSASGLWDDWAKVRFDAVLEELSFWPLLPLLTVGEVILIWKQEKYYFKKWIRCWSWSVGNLNRPLVYQYINICKENVKISALFTKVELYSSAWLGSQGMFVNVKDIRYPSTHTITSIGSFSVRKTGFFKNEFPSNK